MRHGIELVAHLPLKELTDLILAGWVLFRVRRTARHRVTLSGKDACPPLLCSGCGRPVRHRQDATDGVLDAAAETAQAVLESVW